MTTLPPHPQTIDIGAKEWLRGALGLLLVPSIKEVVALLKLAKKTVYAMAQAGRFRLSRYGGRGASIVPSSTSGSARSRAVEMGWSWQIAKQLQGEGRDDV